MMLLMHDAFVLTKFKADNSSEKEANVVDPLGLEGVLVKELVLSRKGKALKLQSVKKVKRKKNDQLVVGKTVFVERRNTCVVDCIGCACQNAEIEKEALESGGIGFAHELDQDTVVEKAISLLALAMLDVGPVFMIGCYFGESVRVGLFVEQLGEQSVLVGLL